MRKGIVLLYCLLLSFIVYGQKGKAKNVGPNYNKALAAELDSIHTDDQKYRKEISGVEKKYGEESKELKALWDTIHIKDSINLIKVEAILDKYGWLGHDIVGSDGCAALFMVIHHCTDITVHEKYLPMFKEALKNGTLSGAHFGLFEDRLNLALGKLQKYGTQLLTDTIGVNHVSPLKNADSVDIWRKQIGLEPMAKYCKGFNVKWSVA